MKMMDKNTETALVFAATIIMEQVCDNPKFSEKQRDKMRKWAGILSDLADKEEKNNAWKINALPQMRMESVIEVMEENTW